MRIVDIRAHPSYERSVDRSSRADCKMSFGVRKAPTGGNFVHNDEIWKDHVHRELQTSHKWPDKWGFLLQDDEPTTGQSSSRLPPLTASRERVEDTADLVTLLDCALRGDGRGRRRGYPLTTAGEIGWKSADFSKLERFGRHARGQQGIRRQLNWPREAIY